MNPTVKKALKTGGWSLGGVLGLLMVFVALLAFPGFMFAHQLAYRNLTVYADQDLRGGMEPILARVAAQVAASEINAPGLEHDIYFGHDNAPFRALQRARLGVVHALFPHISPAAPNYNASWPPFVSQVVSLDVPDPARDLLRREAWPGRLNMTHILTHEVAHSLVMQRLGPAVAARLPFWKQEGYAEYVASTSLRATPGYSLRAGVAKVLATDLAPLRGASGGLRPPGYDWVGKSYLVDENGDQWHTGYYLARLMVEYTLDVQHKNFAQLADSSTGDVDVLVQLLADYHSGKLPAQ